MRVSRLSGGSLAAMLGLAFAACAGRSSAAMPSPGNATVVPAAGGGPCNLFPADNVWNTPIHDAPLDPLSDSYVQAIGLEDTLHPDFGAGLWDGGPIGIPYVEADAETPRSPVAFDYADESDPGPYPIPVDPPIEGGPDSGGDRHVLILERAECRLYELYHVRHGPGGWTAGSGAIFDLRSNALRPAGWTSADAAGLPILPALVRFEEVQAGEIRHALRFTAPRTRRQYVWPARHFASDSQDPDLPPMGTRFRLRADFDLEPFSPPARVILRALQTYGMMLADNGSPWYLSGSPDERWNNDVLRELSQVHGRDFEAVDVAGLIVDSESGQANP